MQKELVKAFWRRRLLTVMAGGLLSAGQPNVAAASDIRVVVTIKPIHALVTQVMGETGTPALLVDGSASPHSYAMKPSDARALNSAQIVFRVSETVEPFTRKIVASLPKSVYVVTLAETPGLKLLEVRSGDTFEAHDHDHNHGHEHGHKRERGKKKTAGANSAAAIDGHIWLDPDNAKVMTDAIAAELSKTAPEHASTFQKNAEALKRNIDALSDEIRRTLEPHRGKPYVVFHDAYQYFESRFDMPAVGSITTSPEVQPSARRLREIRAKIKSLGAQCVFAEPHFKTRLVASVLEGTGARAGVLDPEGTTVKAGAEAYAEIMRGLANNMAVCLQTTRSAN